MSTYIANIKVTSQDVIKNWWKLNYVNIGDKFTDVGEGDVDFYTYWYSICYYAAMLNAYKQIFRDVSEYQEMMRRFLQSRDIAFINDSALDTLAYLYDNWVEEIQKRGTIKVNDFKGQSEENGLTDYTDAGVIADDTFNNEGIGLFVGSNSLEGLLLTGIGLGEYHSIQFDTLLSDPNDAQIAINGTLLNGLNTGITILNNNTPTNGIASYNIIYKCNSISTAFTLNLDVRILNTIKFVRNSDKISLYVNGSFIESKIAAFTVFSPFDAAYLFLGVLPIIANIEVVQKDIDFNNIATTTWKCNEGSGFTLESNHSPVNSAVLNIANDIDWETLWVRDGRLQNTNYIGIDGELKRILNYSFGECLNELISTSEMGLVLDVSSPISEEASCWNLNKMYGKGSVDRLSKFPLIFSAAIKPYIENDRIKYAIPDSNTDFWGINAQLVTPSDWKTLASMKPLGAIPFMPIPVASGLDEIEGYEISFVIQSSENINIKFGLLPYDSEYVLMTNTMKGTSASLFNNMFLDETNFSLCKNRDLWIRGVYTLTHDVNVSQKLNINFGTNLYNILVTDDVKFLLPIIAFAGVSLETFDETFDQTFDQVLHTTVVQIKDLVFRPLSLNTSKGVVQNKNKMISFIKNNSGQSQDSISKFINEKLIPYNCTNNIKYL